MTWISVNDLLNRRAEEEDRELDRYGRPAQPTAEFVRPTLPPARLLLDPPLDVMSATERHDYRSGEWLGQMRSEESKRGAETRKRNKAKS